MPVDHLVQKPVTASSMEIRGFESDRVANFFRSVRLIVREAKVYPACYLFFRRAAPFEVGRLKVEGMRISSCIKATSPFVSNGTILTALWFPSTKSF